jgi:hypothetical protein
VIKKLAAVCVPLACVLLAASPTATAARAKPLPALTPVRADALTRALARGQLTEAQYALQRARSLFGPAAVRREFGDVARPSPRDATPILRDLVVRFRFLSAADRAVARGILARPTDNSEPDEHHYPATAIVATACDSTLPLCFHWDENSADDDAPPGADGVGATIPADVQATMDTFADVYALEVDTYGYLSPLPDGTSTNDGGTDDTDIYLADVGGDSFPVFGYCTTDDPNAFDPDYPFYDASAYCVVDQDFADFGSSQTPQEFRDVTVSHEFFHAIQFHYDFFEDLWLMEGTAMAMEGQFAPDVKDRIRYLDDSTFTSPATPVDRSANGFEYGAWIFWRFLIEDRGELADPLVIRQVWERVAAASTDTDGTGPDTVLSDQYSLQGARNVLASGGLVFQNVFAKFARVNRFPADFYAEGADYPMAATARAWDLGARGSTTGKTTAKLRHLSSRYYRLRPGSRTPTSASVRISVDAPTYGSPSALVIVTPSSGPRTVFTIPLNGSGDGARTFAFGRGHVSRVDLVLTNTSTRMSCWRDTFYSCAGVGLDDLRSYSFRATVS